MPQAHGVVVAPPTAEATLPTHGEMVARAPVKPHAAHHEDHESLMDKKYAKITSVTNAKMMAVDAITLPLASFSKEAHATRGTNADSTILRARR